uniref:Uncharacterized protein n=1 Tax=Oryza glaberrima TaxID=4538 RepID=I1P317_ORYGL
PKVLQSTLAPPTPSTLWLHGKLHLENAQHVGPNVAIACGDELDGMCYQPITLAGNMFTYPLHLSRIHCHLPDGHNFNNTDALRKHVVAMSQVTNNGCSFSLVNQIDNHH